MMDTTKPLTIHRGGDQSKNHETVAEAVTGSAGQLLMMITCRYREIEVEMWHPLSQDQESRTTQSLMSINGLYSRRPNTAPPNTAAHFQVPNKGFVGYI